jgi:ribosome maturation factor RimP
MGYPAQDVSDLNARLFAHETGVAAQVARLAEPVVNELGFRLVRVRNSGRDGGTVQIMAERDDGTLTIEDCAEISRRLSPVLDAYDPLPGRYYLEVSSPGIDRPLVRPADFAAYAGYEAKVELTEPIDGRKRFRGEIEGYEDGEARLKVVLKDGDEPVVLGLPAALIGEAKLVATEALIRASLARSSAQDEAAQDGIADEDQTANGETPAPQQGDG